MRLPTPEEGRRAYNEAFSDALKRRCPTCSKDLSGHFHGQFAAASESNPTAVKQLLESYKKEDWPAVKAVDEVDVLSDIWCVELLKCPTGGIQAILLLDYYDPALSLYVVNVKQVNAPAEEQLEWLSFGALGR